MYIQVQHIRDTPKENKGEHYVEHHLMRMGLFTDDDIFIKDIKQDDVIVKKLKDTKIPIDLPDIMHLLSEKDMDKIQQIQIKKMGVKLFD